MKENDWPRVTWWEPGSVGRGVFVVLSILAAGASFVMAVALRRVLGRQNRLETFTAAAHGFVGVVEEVTSLRRDQIGVNIWLVQGPIGFKRLVRETSATKPRRHTPITWTKGKGVIGQAWDRKKTRHADLERFRAVVPEKSLFCQLPAEERFRLTWEEFGETSRYQAVLAVPLRRERFARHPVGGVVAIDVLVPGKADELKGIQETKEFDSVRRTCEATLTNHR